MPSVNCLNLSCQTLILYTIWHTISHSLGSFAEDLCKKMNLTPPSEMVSQGLLAMVQWSKKRSWLENGSVSYLEKKNYLRPEERCDHEYLPPHPEPDAGHEILFARSIGY